MGVLVMPLLSCKASVVLSGMPSGISLSSIVYNHVPDLLVDLLLPVLYVPLILALQCTFCGTHQRRQPLAFPVSSTAPHTISLYPVNDGINSTAKCDDHDRVMSSHHYYYEGCLLYSSTCLHICSVPVTLVFFSSPFSSTIQPNSRQARS